MMAGIVTTPKASDLKSVVPEDSMKIQDMLDEYEVKETSIIHDLYN